MNKRITVQLKNGAKRVHLVRQMAHDPKLKLGGRLHGGRIVEIDGQGAETVLMDRTLTLTYAALDFSDRFDIHEDSWSREAERGSWER